MLIAPTGAALLLLKDNWCFQNGRAAITVIVIIIKKFAKFNLFSVCFTDTTLFMLLEIFQWKQNEDVLFSGSIISSIF